MLAILDRFIAKEEIPTVSVIGSCRVHVPMRHAQESGLVRLHNYGFESYSHSPSEVLQKLRAAHHRVQFPSHLRILINGTERDGDKILVKRGDYRETSVFLIEISSSRHITIDGFSIQQNFLIEYFVRPNRLEDWWERLCDLNRKEGCAQLSPNEEWISPSVRAIASSVKLKNESESDIRAQMAKICDYLGKPVVFVGHFDFPLSDGSSIKGRARHNKIIRSAAADIGAGYFEPADLISMYGADKAVRDGTNNHWAYSFEKVAGEYLAQNVIKPFIAQRKKQNATA